MDDSRGLALNTNSVLALLLPDFLVLFLLLAFAKVCSAPKFKKTSNDTVQGGCQQACCIITLRLYVLIVLMMKMSNAAISISSKTLFNLTNL